MESSVLQPYLVDAIQALVALLLVIGTYYLRKLASRYATDKQIDQALVLAGQVVAAIDQQATAQGWTNEQRKAFAVTQIKTMAQQHGISLSDETWDVLIEAAVNSARQWQANSGVGQIKG